MASIGHTKAADWPHPAGYTGDPELLAVAGAVGAEVQQVLRPPD